MLNTYLTPFTIINNLIHLIYERILYKQQISTICSTLQLSYYNESTIYIILVMKLYDITTA